MSLFDRTIVAAGAIVALWGWQPAAAPAEVQAPAAVEPVAATEPAETIEGAIAKLGDSDAGVRRGAAEFLWSAGKSAEAALKEAESSDDPQIAREARVILDKFAYGLYPDTPREIFILLDLYRRGDPATRRATVDRLAAAGPRGCRVLVRLRRDEDDEQLRAAIQQVLETHGREAAGLLIGEGDFATAGQLLETAAAGGANPARDYAAFLLLHGGLRERLAKLEAAGAEGRGLGTKDATLLAILARAGGDLPTARRAAEKCPDGELLESILIEQGDWKPLAVRLADRARSSDSIEDLGFLSAYYRLGGDTPNFLKTLGRIQEYANRHPDYSWHCAEALFLDDHPDAAVALLLKHHNYLDASDFLAPRLKFREAVGLPEQAASEGAVMKPAVRLALKVKSAGALRFIGDAAGARRALEEAARENAGLRDYTVYALLAEVSQQIGQADQASGYAVSALSVATPNDAVGSLFQKLGLGEGYPAARWWAVLRRTDPQQPPRAALDRVRAIFDRTMPAAELEVLAAAVQRHALRLQPEERESWLELIADTLLAAGRQPSAERCLRVLASQLPTPTGPLRLGDLEAARKDWNAAALSYAQAWERDRSQAAPLFLHGWALSHVPGHEKEGRERMDLAHLLPLGNEKARHALLDVLTRHELADDARRERELIRRTGAFMSWETSDALRRDADEAQAKGDYLTAADLWDRAFLDNFSTNTSFMEPWANVVIPAMIHKSRALGLVKAGDVARAMKEANLAVNDSPGDVDGVIEMVNALDAAGNKAEAADLFSRTSAVWEQLCADYPESGLAQNQLAWGQVRCNRNLDAALTHARRAVELDPTSTASLDTLAEVHFARGDVQKAIETINRCIELEPKVEHHHKQLERFKAALEKRPR